MSEELSALNLRDDLEEVKCTPDAARWVLEVAAPLTVLVTMSPAADPKEAFQAQLLWRVYPDDAPSLKFRDPQSGRLDLPSAWPKVHGFRPTSLDACVNYCKEGFNLHPEWAGDPKYRWDPRANPLLRVLRTLQDDLDHHYQGRHP
jgi:hypothetical protein